jgi:hypothetical protein
MSAAMRIFILFCSLKRCLDLSIPPGIEEIDRR